MTKMADDAPHVYNMCNGMDSYPCWAVYIGRPSRWGNPFAIGKDGTREEVMAKYELLLKRSPHLIKEIKRELRGKDLLCWCSPLPCHGDILLRIANGGQ